MARSSFGKMGRSFERGFEIGVNEALIGVGILAGSLLIWGVWNWLKSEW
jgi:hypothetical protein